MKTTKLILLSCCILVCVSTLRAQDNTPDPQRLQTEIERLQKLLELQQLQQSDGQPGQPRHEPSEQPGHTSPEQPRYAPSEQPQYAQPQYHTQPLGPVTLRPFDTGRSVVTFNLGDNKPDRSDGRLVVKTNLIYAAVAQSPNLSFEYGLGPRTSVEVAVGYNGWHNLWDNAEMESAEDGKVQVMNSYKRQLDHLFLKAEYRYWLRERFSGHFFGAGALFADYRVGQVDLPLLFEKEYEYEGKAWGAALTYGYVWRWNPRWAVEFSLSGGLVKLEYDKSVIELQTDSYRLQGKMAYAKTYFGPTAAGIKLVFTIL